MKRYTQILWGKAHWIFEAEEQLEFAPDIVIVDITDKPEVKEGWDFNPETEEFTAPTFSVPEPTKETVDPIQQLIELQAQTVLNTEMLLLQKEIGI
ncbi:hypothetical protein VO178_09355 [Lysinibacillus fusiformis]|uniref:hypothetical protein n=1 Tax=Lysinibacillus fusiformis TaxID=28031 RepID=UPI002D77C338|nr:hypothetical protein [Lysinibacillus fusiformis]WRS99883.1 hypothetical protein VO178_09355 [Lysinibacillus fusiformis]